MSLQLLAQHAQELGYNRPVGADILHVGPARAHLVSFLLDALLQLSPTGIEGLLEKFDAKGDTPPHSKVAHCECICSQPSQVLPLADCSL